MLSAIQCKDPRSQQLLQSARQCQSEGLNPASCPATREQLLERVIPKLLSTSPVSERVMGAPWVIALIS